VRTFDGGNVGRLVGGLVGNEVGCEAGGFAPLFRADVATCAGGAACWTQTPLEGSSEVWSEGK
jgi:hypothetical protein